MLFEIFAVLWLFVLMVAVYFFVKSLTEALSKGRDSGIIGESKRSRVHTVPARHSIPTGHRGRTPAH